MARTVHRIDEWLKVADVAKYPGVQEHTVYKLIDDGKLTAEGGSKTALGPKGTLKQRRAGTRVKQADLQAFVEAARVKPGELRHLTHGPRTPPPLRAVPGRSATPR